MAKRLFTTRKYSPEAKNVWLTIPNIISLLRICSVPFIALFIAEHRMIAALIVLAISSFTDFVDGIVARTFNQVSKIGQLLDPLADRLLITCSALALCVANIIPWWVIAVIFARDVVLSLLILWLAQYGYGVLPVHFVGKAGTALLMMTMVALMISDISSALWTSYLNIAGLACGIWAVGLYWLAGILYICQGVKLLAHEKHNKA